MTKPSASRPRRATATYRKGYATADDAWAAQPSTAENPNESAYERGRFDGVMAYGVAIERLRAPASCIDIARLPKHDRYNRSLATVRVQGRDVAATLIVAGLSRPYVCGGHCPKRLSWCGG